MVVWVILDVSVVLSIPNATLRFTAAVTYKVMNSLYLGKCPTEEFKTPVGRIGELEYYRITSNVN